MNTVVNPLEGQWIEAARRVIEDNFSSLNERAVKPVKFIHTYRLELKLTALTAFVLLSSIYVLFFAPPVPPCVDIYP